MKKVSLMSTSGYRYTKHHLVSLSRFETSITRVLEFMYSITKDYKKNSLTPLLIGIDVRYGNHPNPVPLFRQFLNKLHLLRERYFIRFITDTLWAFESDYGYNFYASDKSKFDKCDIVWNVTASGLEQVEIEVLFPKLNNDKELINQLSEHLRKFIPLSRQTITPDYLVKTMIDFYKQNKKICRINQLEDQFHILLIPTLKGNGFYPVPLQGMSLEDARRHYKQVTSQLAYQQHNYHEFFGNPVNTTDLLYILVTLLQDTHYFDKKKNIAQEAYGLAEFLLGWLATHNQGIDSNHEIILFYIKDRNLRITNGYRLCMHDLVEYR